MKTLSDHEDHAKGWL